MFCPTENLPIKVYLNVPFKNVEYGFNTIRQTSCLVISETEGDVGAVISI